MNFRYPRHRIQEIVQAPKGLSEGKAFTIERKGEQGAKFETPVDLLDGPFCDLRFLGRAGRQDEPTSYDASFLLDQQRVRGVGHCAVARQNFRAKRRVPAGWHQNICDPNMPTDHPEWNRHESLPDFAPVDFQDFVRQVAALWVIDLSWEQGLL